jgi:amino acid transporter
MDPLDIKHHARPTLGTFKLLMIAIISVDSIRNLPINAQYGPPLITFFLIAGVGFFLPLLLITNFLAKSYPLTGGSYVWVEKAFGHRWGFLSVWLQWVYNMIWYPTIMAFIAATVGYMIDSSLQSSTHFILIVSLILFWLMTFICCWGVKSLSWISMVSSFIGTLLPMLLIILLAIGWLLGGHPSETPISWQSLIPTKGNFANLAFFSNILFSLLGIDMIAMHGGDVKRPNHTYPRVLILSGIIILGSLMASSLAICILTPPGKIGLVDGLINAVDFFAFKQGMDWVRSFIAIAIILGGIGIVTSWMVGLARGLHVAAFSANVPKFFEKLNSHRMPYPILIAQALIFSALVTVFLLFPAINSSYWLLSSMTAQFAMIYYFVFFFASYKLLKNKGLGKKYFLWIVLAMGSCVAGFLVGFFPPESVISREQIFNYELIIVLGGIVFFTPLIYFLRKSRSIRKTNEPK